MADKVSFELLAQAAVAAPVAAPKTYMVTEEQYRVVEKWGTKGLDAYCELQNMQLEELRQLMGKISRLMNDGNRAESHRLLQTCKGKVETLMQANTKLINK